MAEIDFQAVHAVQAGALEDALIEVLQKHAGERVNGLMSIDSNAALVAMIPLMANLLAPRHDDEKLINELRRGVKHIRRKMAQRIMPLPGLPS